MIDKLKTFISKHKQEFDAAEPSQDLWKKIDARMEVKNSSSISSKWLSKLKYFGLSASVLVIAAYFVSQKLNNSSSNELAQTTNDSALNNSGEWVKANQNKADINNSGNNFSNADNEKGKSYNALAGSPTTSEKSTTLIEQATENAKRDSVNSLSDENITSEQNKLKAEINSLSKEEESSNITHEKNNLSKSSKKTRIHIPSESEKVNSYNGTLYESSSFCALLQAYKFPGKVNLDKSRNYTTHRTMITVSCSRLENTTNMKAVWLKGKTSKKITIAMKEGFKNILLIKSDGRKLCPEAISHYYKGLGVISGYTGKYFDIIFDSKVDLILFFKDVEEGDKIVIDGVIEAVVKNTP